MNSVAMGIDATDFCHITLNTTPPVRPIRRAVSVQALTTSGDKSKRGLPPHVTTTFCCSTTWYLKRQTR